VIVTLSSPEAGLFCRDSRANDTTGASKVYRKLPVPAIWFTASKRACPEERSMAEETGGELAYTVVADVHDVVRTKPAVNRDSVAVQSLGAKLRPAMVSDAPPETGPFAIAERVRAGPSYVKRRVEVPTIAATVTETSGVVPTVKLLLGVPHCNEVPDCHDVVAQEIASLR